jgi:hypothetical protein
MLRTGKFIRNLLNQCLDVEVTFIFCFAESSTVVAADIAANGQAGGAIISNLLVIHS